MAGKSDLKVAAKMASLSIVWGVLAGVAYLGIIAFLVSRLSQLGVNGPTVNTEGLRSISPDMRGAPAAGVLTLLVDALPFAIGAVILLAIAARALPQLVPVPALMILAALIGFVGTAILFLNRMNLTGNRTEFLIALGTIVGLAIVARLERYVRRLNRNNPAVGSLLLAVLVVAYLVASTVATIPTLILGEIDVWLALAGFLIVLYAGIRLLRASMRI
jgi:hypothetical protein